MKHIDWFTQARFGMFIHFGAYSKIGRGEWVRSNEEISVEDYQPYVDNFNPDKLDLKKWAKMAKKAGMKYAVLTSKHHDGFCLFDSEYTEYKSTNTPCKRDIVKEFLDAFRNEGIKVGLYYSLLDWHHPDYPHYQDLHHPMRNNPAYNNENRNFDNYLSYMHNQVKELCTNYGKLDIMWFDFSYEEMTAEKWQASKLVKMVRELQPDIIINNRLEDCQNGKGSIFTDEPAFYKGDFTTPEKVIPPNGLFTPKGNPILWEACVTMNDNWGYHYGDHDYKPASTLIRKLVECVSKGGNMILNVGPDGSGQFPKEAVKILNAFSKWMKINGNAIYNCGKADLAKPENGRLTQNGKFLYYHIYEDDLGSIPLYGINKNQVKNMRILANNKSTKPADNWIISNYTDICFIDAHINAKLPDPIDTVIEIELY